MVGDESNLPKDRLAALKNHQDYLEHYYKKNGIHYLHPYDGIRNQPRDKPKYFMYDAKYIGQQHTVTSDHLHW